MVPYYGDFASNTVFSIGNEPETITLNVKPKSTRLPAEAAGGKIFSDNIVRLSIKCDSPFRLHSIVAENIRPPEKSEVPEKKLITCGTSITQQASCTAAHLSYPAVAARCLDMDLVNYGLGGSFHCEKELADYIAENNNWDVMSAEISVNMVSQFSIEEYTERTSYFIKRMAEAAPDKPLAVITILPHGRDFDEVKSDEKKDVEPYRQSIRDTVKNLNMPNIHLIEGKDLLKDIKGLSSDLVHPSDFGMYEIGRNLAEIIKTINHG
ncbi:MAG: SGNH/GDSL hydrolase family protein [Planctomycetota bacterium]|jgi:hypothetical protein